MIEMVSYPVAFQAALALVIGLLAHLEVIADICSFKNLPLVTLWALGLFFNAYFSMIVH